MNTLEIMLGSLLLIIAGFIAGHTERTMTIENGCLYENRIELTNGRVLECQYLDGVERK